MQKQQVVNPGGHGAPRGLPSAVLCLQCLLWEAWTGLGEASGSGNSPPCCPNPSWLFGVRWTEKQTLFLHGLRQGGQGRNNCPIVRTV